MPAVSHTWSNLSRTDPGQQGGVESMRTVSAGGCWNREDRFSYLLRGTDEAVLGVTGSLRTVTGCPGLRDSGFSTLTTPGFSHARSFRKRFGWRTGVAGSAGVSGGVFSPAAVLYNRTDSFVRSSACACPLRVSQLHVFSVLSGPRIATHPRGQVALEGPPDTGRWMLQGPR